MKKIAVVSEIDFRLENFSGLHERNSIAAIRTSTDETRIMIRMDLFIIKISNTSY